MHDDIENGSDASASSDATIVFASNGVLRILLKLEFSKSLVGDLGEGARNEKRVARFLALEVLRHFPAIWEIRVRSVDLDKEIDATILQDVGDRSVLSL